jgi:DNA-binding MarR family transcriptional regulator
VRFLQLTEQGEALMRSHEEAQLRRMERCLRQMSQEEAAQVLRALGALVESCESLNMSAQK